MQGVSGISGVDGKPRYRRKRCRASKEPDAEVFAGSINNEALLRTCAFTKARQTTPSPAIVRLGRKSKSDRAPDRAVSSSRFQPIYIARRGGLGCIGRRSCPRLPSEGAWDGMVIVHLALLLDRLAPVHW